MKNMKNMKNMMLWWFSLFFLPAHGELSIGSLRKHDNLRKIVLSVAKSFSNYTYPESPAKCETDADCANKCWCSKRLCYGGKYDDTCATKENGHTFKDNSWCWDGRRDHNCANQDSMELDELSEAAVDQVEKDAQKTMKKAAKMDPGEMAQDDVQMMLDYLMPGKRPNIIKKITELSLVIVALAWFAIYKIWIYDDDRSWRLDHYRWDDVVIPPRQDDERIKLMKPDMVLVFHKPDFDYSDKDKELPSSVLETAIVGRSGHFPRSEALLNTACANRKSFVQRIQRLQKKATGLAEKAEKAAAKVVGHQHEDSETNEPKAAGKRRASTWIDTSEREEEDEDTDVKTKKGVFRQALLQDVVDSLPQKGFDVEVFSSVDNDELFVCIRLRNDLIIKQHLQRYGMKCQIQHEVVNTLDISQPYDEVESSPPYIRYDRRLAENVLGEGKTDLDIFKIYGAHSGHPVIICGTDRIRIIHKHLNHLMNLDYCVAQGLIVKWYPAHAEARIADLQRSWARWSLITDLTIRQPLSLLNEYFGSRVAFIFAWIGLYAKMLLCLVPVALVWVVLNFAAHMIGKTDFWHRGSVLGFSLAVVVWSRMVWNCWRQEEEFLNILWDLNHTGRDKSMRPDFIGTLGPDPADQFKDSHAYPAWKSGVRMFFSWLITLVFCTFVFTCLALWMDLFKGRLTIAASIVQAIMVQVFTQTYNIMAEQLTLAENHKYQDTFYNSYLKKMFIFQLVNQYAAFFYMAVKQQFQPGGCPDDDCVILIQRALPVTLLVLAIIQIVQVYVGTLLVWLSLWWEKRNLGDQNQIYSFVEEQGKYGAFRIREQIEVMTQLSLTLGYVLIFGCVAPRIVPLCFVVFMVQLRAGGILMTTAVNRTVPRTTVGIGPWNDVFYFLMLLGVLFSAYLLVQFGPLFKGTQLLTKVSCMFFYCFFIGLVWVCVDIVCPPTDASNELLEDRRKVVEARLHHIHEDKNFEQGQATSPNPSPRTGPTGKIQQGRHHVFGESIHVHEIVDGAWDAIPKALPDEDKPGAFRHRASVSC